MSAGWRPIPGFPGYEASSEGEIRPVLPRYGVSAVELVGERVVRRGQTIKPWIEERHGRMAARIALHTNGLRTKQFVHRLVCLAFHDLPPEGGERIDCCHIDHNSLNNRASNLKWDTHAKNIEANYERRAIMEEELTELMGPLSMRGSLASPESMAEVPF